MVANEKNSAVKINLDIKVQNEIDEGKTWPQILAILIGCIGAITNGILLGWTSPFIVIISQDKENYDISEEEASYFTVLPPLGLIVGSLIFFKLNDLIGRKKTFMLIALPHTTSWLLIIFAKNVYEFYLSRFISGIGDGALFTTLPMYIGEISTPKVRGTWGTSIIFFATGGTFFINAIGNYLGVKQTAYVCILLPIIFVVLFSFMPESPYYCIMKGQDERAKECLKFFTRKENIEQDYIRLKADVHRQISESGSWKDLFSIKSNRRALTAGIFLRYSQQMSGATIFGSYTQYIFLKAGGKINPQYSSLIFCGSCWFLLLFSGGLLDRIGRKKAFMWSSLLCGLMLMVESTYFYLEFDNRVDVTVVSWIPLAGMMGYIISFTFGVGPIPTVMLGELFSASIKVKGMCFLNILFGLAIFISTNVFNLLNTYVGLFCPFLVFAVCCFVSTVLTNYFVPETSGKTLEEIQQSLKQKRLEKRRRSRTI